MKYVIIFVIIVLLIVYLKYYFKESFYSRKIKTFPEKDLFRNRMMPMQQYQPNNEIPHNVQIMPSNNQMMPPNNQMMAKNYEYKTGIDYGTNNYKHPEVLKNFLNESDLKIILNYVNKLNLVNGEVGAFNLDNMHRNNKIAWIEKYLIENMENIYIKLENILGIPRNNFEHLQVSKYTKGQFYKKHFDQSPYYNETDKDNLFVDNPRIKTLIMYLNDDYKGGKTTFVNLNKSYKLNKGDALLFDIFNDKKDQVHYLSEHEGELVEDGVKWIATIWIKKYEFKFN